jgi:hypothetical protein
METRLKLVETALQELGKVYDSTMRQIVDCKKLLSLEEETAEEDWRDASSYSSSSQCRCRLCFSIINYPMLL